uniref:Uncharacterized protein n=1 Tax=Oryza brachyantha TaxID=4533 RepID=J3MSE2_ORYBR
ILLPTFFFILHLYLHPQTTKTKTIDRLLVSTAASSRRGAEEMFPGLIHHHHRRPDADGGGGLAAVGAVTGLVLTADPKPRLRWTADLHDRFVDAVAPLGLDFACAH